ncbi:MAG TPA: hypothetical protein VF954_00900, partial [Acidimicrobiales bacterium]
MTRRVTAHRPIGRYTCRGLAVAFLAGAGVYLLGAGAARADGAPDKTGWWSEVQQAPVAIPLSTATGSNLVVGNDPTGADNVAAVQYTVPSGTSRASAGGHLSLTIAPNTSVGTVQLAACPIAGDWQPVEGGPWTAKPNWSCAASAPGTVSSDGTTVSFALTAAVQSSAGVFSLAIVPATGAGAFQVQLSNPDASSFTATGGPTEEPPPDTSSNPLDTAGPASASQAVLPAPEPSGSLPVDTVPPSPPVETSPAPGPASPSAPAASPALVQPAASSHGAFNDRPHRVLAGAILALMAASAWWLGGSAARPPQLLGSLGARSAPAAGAAAAPPTGGIGRF